MRGSAFPFADGVITCGCDAETVAAKAVAVASDGPDRQEAAEKLAGGRTLPPPAFEEKICPSEALAERVKTLPRPVVFTNGVFDILHRGHVTYLAQARALGGSLVVAVNSDRSVKMLGKGDDRPINAEDDRAALLAALESVSLVTVFDEKTPCDVLGFVRPDIYVKGGDYRVEDLPEAKLCRTWGADTVTVRFEHRKSTTELIKKIRRTL